MDGKNGITFEEWILLGKEQVETFDKDIETLRKKISLLRNERDKLAKILVQISNVSVQSPESKRTSSSSNCEEDEEDFSKKVIIKPILLSILIENEGQEYDPDDLVDFVQSENPRASAHSIRTSLDRLIRTHDHIYRKPTGKVYYKS